ncbi:MAG: hypothetical protein ACRD5L_06440, partial [Bryobacteraceae bacterium]
TTSPQVRERILLVNVGDHLDRTQMVLLEISNADGGEGGKNQEVDISHEQKRAEDLLSANRLYRQTALHTGDAAVASVLDELEPILLDIAHSPSKVSRAELDDFQRRISSHGLLLKVRLLDSNVRERDKTPAQNSGPNGL